MISADKCKKMKALMIGTMVVVIFVVLSSNHHSNSTTVVIEWKTGV